MNICKRAIAGCHSWRCDAKTFKLHVFFFLYFKLADRNSSSVPFFLLPALGLYSCGVALLATRQRGSLESKAAIFLCIFFYLSQKVSWRRLMTLLKQSPSIFLPSFPSRNAFTHCLSFPLQVSSPAFPCSLFPFPNVPFPPAVTPSLSPFSPFRHTLPLHPSRPSPHNQCSPK